MADHADSRTLVARNASPWLFFAAAFAWTWSFWLAAAAIGTGVETATGRALLDLGLAGPMLAGIGFAWATLTADGWRDYWRRVVDPRLIPARWFWVAVLAAPVIMGIAVAIDVAGGDPAAPAQFAAKAAALAAAPSTIVPAALGVLLYGPLPEELGWRGYVLDRLQERFSALLASLILGVVWALWHLPLFFIKGTFHAAQGVGSAWFWLFLVGVVPYAVVIAWIYDNTRRSTLAAILVHVVTNLVYIAANATAGTNLYATVLWIVAAAVVVWLWGAATLARA